MELRLRSDQTYWNHHMAVHQCSMLSEKTASGWGQCLCYIREDGTVQSFGFNAPMARIIDTWRNITELRMTSNHLMALREDGVVHTIGEWHSETHRSPVWRGIADIGIEQYGIYGLRQDGRVVCEGADEKVSSQVFQWRDIRLLRQQSRLVVGIRTDGTLVMAGSDSPIYKDALEWNQLDDVTLGARFMIGRTTDGRLLLAGQKSSFPVLDGWANVRRVAIPGYTYGMKADGSICCTDHLLGFNFTHSKERMEICAWKDIIEFVHEEEHGSRILGIDRRGNVHGTGFWVDDMILNLLPSIHFKVQ